MQSNDAVIVAQHQKRFVHWNRSCQGGVVVWQRNWLDFLISVFDLHTIQRTRDGTSIDECGRARVLWVDSVPATGAQTNATPTPTCLESRPFSWTTSVSTCLARPASAGGAIRRPTLAPCRRLRSRDSSSLAALDTDWRVRCEWCVLCAGLPVVFHYVEHEHQIKSTQIYKKNSQWRSFSMF